MLPHVSAQESWRKRSEIGLERARGKRERDRRAISYPMRKCVSPGREVRDMARAESDGIGYLGGKHGAT